MLPIEQCAWLAREWTRTAYATYGEISKMTGIDKSKLSKAIRAFYDGKHILVNEPFGEYWCDVKKIVNAYEQAGGQFEKPPPSEKRLRLGHCSARENEARHEHAWLLRAEGMTLKDIGARLGLNEGRARLMVLRFGKRMMKAKRLTRFTVT